MDDDAAKLRSLLTVENFDANTFLNQLLSKNKAKDGVSEDELNDIRNRLTATQQSASIGLRSLVSRHSDKLISTAKEMITLESEMGQLNNLLNDQRSLTSSMKSVAASLMTSQSLDDRLSESKKRKNNPFDINDDDNNNKNNFPMSYNEDDEDGLTNSIQDDLYRLKTLNIHSSLELVDVAIAQRDFDRAVTLILHLKESNPYFRSSIAANSIELRLDDEKTKKQLKDEMMNEISADVELRNREMLIRLALLKEFTLRPSTSQRCIDLHSRLGYTRHARYLTIWQQSNIIDDSLKRIRLDETSTVYIREQTKEFCIGISQTIHSALINVYHHDNGENTISTSYLLNRECMEEWKVAELHADLYTWIKNRVHHFLTHLTNLNYLSGDDENFSSTMNNIDTIFSTIQSQLSNSMKSTNYPSMNIIRLVQVELLPLVRKAIEDKKQKFVNVIRQRSRIDDWQRASFKTNDECVRSLNEFYQELSSDNGATSEKLKIFLRKQVFDLRRSTPLKNDFDNDNVMEQQWTNEEKDGELSYIDMTQNCLSFMKNFLRLSNELCRIFYGNISYDIYTALVQIFKAQLRIIERAMSDRSKNIHFIYRQLQFVFDPILVKIRQDFYQASGLPVPYLENLEDRRQSFEVTYKKLLSQ